MKLRPATAEDAAALAEIYGHYVRESDATFEKTSPPAAELGRRLVAVQAAGLPWLVADAGGVVLGFAYASPYRPRSAYRHTVETSIYLDDAARGQGHGAALYGALLDVLRAHGGLHSAVASIALPAPASIALHERLGFRKVGHIEEAGFKHGRWIDVGYWQVQLGPCAPAH